jgi:hypothetical protein
MNGPAKASEHSASTPSGIPDRKTGPGTAQQRQAHDGLRITDHTDFTNESFAFGEHIRYKKFGTEKIRLTSPGGRTLLLEITDCLSYGVNKSNRFGKLEFTLPISLGDEHQAIIPVLDLIGEECVEFTMNPLKQKSAMKCLYKKGRTPVLYAKMDDETVFFDSSGVVTGHRKFRGKRFRLDAIIRIESLYIAVDGGVSIQVKLHGVRVRPDRPELIRMSDTPLLPGSLSSDEE